MTSTYQEYYSEYTQNTSKKSGPLPFGFHNTATSNQTWPKGFLDLVLRMPLKGAQEGLVLTITSQDYIIHWPDTVPEDDDGQLVDDTTTAILPYQEGDSIYNFETSTKVINSSTSTEINDDDRTTHAREVLMIRRPRSPLIPLEALDVRSSDESKSNISPFIQGHDGETESQRQARERKNKLKQGCQRRAKQRKDTWIKYESDLAEYNRRKSEREVKEGRVANTPYDKI